MAGAMSALAPSDRAPGLLIEIGEEAIVGAGSVVTRDVAPRTVVVGSPARVLREVRDDELLDPLAG
jgi:acetyltransferase-like isoleucine patch superfamily enzyme